jgi:hypothetical protein
MTLDLRRREMSIKPIPWRRFWVRYFDYFLHSFLVVAIWTFIDIESLIATNNILLGFLLMVFWILLDGVYMAYFGTTLGKKMMKIKVTMQDGAKMSRFVAFKRSRLVWLRGMGLGIGIIELITNIVGYRKLKKEKITSWDRDLGLEVTHERIGFLRLLICPSVVIGITGLILYSLTENM